MQALVSSSSQDCKVPEIEYIPFPLSAEDQERLDKKLGLWKALPASVTQSCLASCGYLSLIKLEPPNPTDELNPHGGVMNLENAILLQEEVDNMSETDEKAKKPLVLMTEKRQYLLGINFGIPLFDSDLNKSICQKIVINNLWNNDNLMAVEKHGLELSEKLTGFINEFQDKSYANSDKFLVTPEERRVQRVPLPSIPLYFDGARLLTM